MNRFSEKSYFDSSEADNSTHYSIKIYVDLKLQHHIVLIPYEL